jgi:hypothetical protein
MSLELALLEVLGGLVAGRVYPDLAPSGETTPYIVYQGVGGQLLTFVESEAPDIENHRVQIAIWGDTREVVSALRRAALVALVESPVLRAEVLSGPISRYEEITQLRGVMQDFSIWI